MEGGRKTNQNWWKNALSLLRVLSSVTLCTSFEGGRESERVEIMKREKLLNYTEDKDWASLIILPHHGAWQRNSHSDQQPTVSLLLLLFRRQSTIELLSLLFLSVSLNGLNGLNGLNASNVASVLNALFLPLPAFYFFSDLPSVLSSHPFPTAILHSLVQKCVRDDSERVTSRYVRHWRKKDDRDRDGKRYSLRTSIRFKWGAGKREE